MCVCVCVCVGARVCKRTLACVWAGYHSMFQLKVMLRILLFCLDFLKEKKKNNANSKDKQYIDEDTLHRTCSGMIRRLIYITNGKTLPWQDIPISSLNAIHLFVDSIPYSLQRLSFAGMFFIWPTVEQWGEENGSSVRQKKKSLTVYGETNRRK